MRQLLRLYTFNRRSDRHFPTERPSASNGERSAASIVRRQPSVSDSSARPHHRPERRPWSGSSSRGFIRFRYALIEARADRQCMTAKRCPVRSGQHSALIVVSRLTLAFDTVPDKRDRPRRRSTARLTPALIARRVGSGAQFRAGADVDLPALRVRNRLRTASSPRRCWEATATLTTTYLSFPEIHTEP
jgi:hypothetical protein